MNKTMVTYVNIVQKQLINALLLYTTKPRPSTKTQ